MERRPGSVIGAMAAVSILQNYQKGGKGNVQPKKEAPSAGNLHRSKIAAGFSSRNSRHDTHALRGLTPSRWGFIS